MFSHDVFSHQDAKKAKKLAMNEAEDNKGLWENEIQSRSRLGLRVNCLKI